MSLSHIWRWLTTSPWDTIQYKIRQDKYVEYLYDINAGLRDTIVEQAVHIETLDAAIVEYKRRIEELDFISTADKRLPLQLSDSHKKGMRFQFDCQFCNLNVNETRVPQTVWVGEQGALQACVRCSDMLRNDIQPQVTDERPLRSLSELERVFS